jgi:hypothetical protein
MAGECVVAPLPAMTIVPAHPVILADALLGPSGCRYHPDVAPPRIAFLAIFCYRQSRFRGVAGLAQSIQVIANNWR